MKIAVMGAHGTGKSTLTKGIADKMGFNIIPDVVPQAYKLGFAINESTPQKLNFGY